MIIGSIIVGLIGLGGTFYAGEQQKKLSEQALQQAKLQAFASQKTLLTLAEIGGLSLLAFSAAYLIAKKGV